MEPCARCPSGARRVLGAAGSKGGVPPARVARSLGIDPSFVFTPRKFRRAYLGVEPQISRNFRYFDTVCEKNERAPRVSPRPSTVLYTFHWSLSTTAHVTLLHMAAGRRAPCPWPTHQTRVRSHNPSSPKHEQPPNTRVPPRSPSWRAAHARARYSALYKLRDSAHADALARGRGERSGNCLLCMSDE